MFVLCLVAACATSPLGRRQLMLFSDDQIDAMGIDSFDHLKADVPVSRDPAMNAYVVCVANALTAELDPAVRSGWEVVVFEDPTANAFALPGRKIGVHTGLLKVAVGADQLAAVVGHEIGHVLAHHGNERVSQQYAAQATLAAASVMTNPNTAEGQATMAALGIGARYGVLLPFSRSQESEADLLGIDLMARAGFDPAQSVELWKNMGKAAGGQAPPEWMSTHPSSSSRIAALSERVPAAERLRAEALAKGRRPVCAAPGTAR
jgi:predicted Zn-dependent protease